MIRRKVLRWWCLPQIIGVLAFASLTNFAAVQHFKRKNMYIVPIAWLYVAFMMAVAEATSSQGTVLGAFFTFVLYGLMPIGLVLYFMGTPARKRARLELEGRQNQALAQAQSTGEEYSSGQPDTGSKPPADPIAPVRKEP